MSGPSNILTCSICGYTMSVWIIDGQSVCVCVVCTCVYVSVCPLYISSNFTEGVLLYWDGHGHVGLGNIVLPTYSKPPSIILSHIWEVGGGDTRVPALFPFPTVAQK